MNEEGREDLGHQFLSSTWQPGKKVDRESLESEVRRPKLNVCVREREGRRESTHEQLNMMIEWRNTTFIQEAENSSLRRLRSTSKHVSLVLKVEKLTDYTHCHHCSGMMIESRNLFLRPFRTRPTFAKSPLHHEEGNFSLPWL